MKAGTFTPQPAAAPIGRMLAAQTGMELRLTLRNGEQLLLNLVIPVLLVIVLASQPFLDLGDGRQVDGALPGVLALAVLSASFTGLAIATGFERKYGVIRWLGATALPRSVLLGGKTLAVAGVEVLQIAVLCAVGFAFGWRPEGSPLSVAVLVVLGTAAFAGPALLLAGTLRAEATLAAANLVWFLLLFFGGLIVPTSEFPAPFGDVLGYLPTAALADGLRAVLADGAPLPWTSVVVLAGWAVAGLAAAVRFFRWE